MFFTYYYQNKTLSKKQINKNVLKFEANNNQKYKIKNI